MNCPKCGTGNFREGSTCRGCGHSTDDCVVSRLNRATHRTTNAPPDITKALPSRKVNGSREEK